MRHRKAGRKFGRNSAQRQALLRQLAISMILHERLTTTEAKAKSLRPVVEKLVTIARSDSEHHRSLVMSKIDHSTGNHETLRGDRAPIRSCARGVHPDIEARRASW